jgi:hypothetical protein
MKIQNVVFIPLYPSYLVISVPPSSAGGVQLTRTLSWNTSVTLHVSGGVGLSELWVLALIVAIIISYP